MSDYENKPWVKVQTETFTNWVNSILKGSCYIENIHSGLADGLALIKLYENLTGKRLKKYNKNPRLNIQKIENLSSVLNEFKKDKVKLINIGAEDLVEKNSKIDLGLIWTLILHYQIVGLDRLSSVSQPSAKELLLNWVNDRLKDYEIDNITNFKKDWSDGVALSYLVDSMWPGSYPKEIHPDSSFDKIEEAIKFAKKKFDIDKILEPKYVANATDEKSMMTYIALFKEKSKTIKSFSKEVDYKETIAYGKGLEDSSNADSPHSFTIELKDDMSHQYKKELSSDNDLKIIIKGPQDVQYNIVNPETKKDGIYHIQYEAVKPGEYNIDITLFDFEKRIKNSPFVFKISKAEPKIYGDGFSDHNLNKKQTVIIDSGTNNGGLAEENNVKLKILSPSNTEIPITVKDLENGKYEFEYISTEEGEEKISAYVWDEPLIEDKVVKVTLSVEDQKKKIDEAIIKYHGDVLDNGIPDSDATGFIISAYNKDGTPINDIDFNVKMKKKENDEFVSGISTNNKMDGNTEVNIDCEETGPFELLIYANDETEPRKTFPIKSYTKTQPNIVEGSFTFEIHAKGKNGQLKTTGGDKWTVDIVGPNESKIDVTTTDHNDGRYSAKYQLSAEEGKRNLFTVSAKLNDQHVASSPFDHTLSEKKSLSKRIRNFFQK